MHSDTHQQGGNSRGRSNSIAGCITALIQGLAASAEIFLHDADTFGSRYLKCQVGRVLVLLFVQAVFWRHHNLDGLVFFGILFLLRSLWVMVRVALCTARGGVEPHSGYSGTPHLARLFPRAAECRIKEGYEPWLTCAVGACIAAWSPPLGLYLIYAGFAAGVWTSMVRRSERERAIALNDAYLEQRGVVERFHDLRAD